MRMKSLLCIILILFTSFYIPLLSQELPEFTFTDPVGDVDPPCPSVDYVGGWFVQQGDTLFFGYQMAAPLADRIPWGNAFNEFSINIDDGIPCTGSYCADDYLLDFMDWGDGNWFGNFYVDWDWDFYSYMERLSVPVIVQKDGKSLTCKVSLIGTDWNEIEYSGSGWYKDGSTWHQVPHYGGDAIETQPYTFDTGQITLLEEKTGTNCVIKVPAPYSATADAKYITSVVDEMVNIVRSKIGAIAESDKKFIVNYENFTYYAHPCSYGFGGINQFGCRIPGQYWVDEPNWYAMLEGVVDQTLQELSAGLREVLLGQKAYHRPIPGSGEGWYCTDDDSTNGFKWDAHHKWTFKALLSNAYENCYIFHIAENLSDGDAKTAIMNKNADMIDAWENFSGTAKELTPEIMTGLLLSLTDDLSWTERIFKDIIPIDFDIKDADTTAFEQIVIDYIRHEDFIITSTNDFLTQAHHGWYAAIASVQTAILEQATGEDVYGVLQNLSGFPLDQEIFNTTKELPVEVATNDESEKPVDFILFQNYPNPFNPLTNIVFDLPEESRVSLVIYDLAGHKVWEMTNNGEVMSPGQYTFQWNGTNMDNSKVASGLYLFRLITPEYNQTKKAVFMK